MLPLERCRTIYKLKSAESLFAENHTKALLQTIIDSCFSYYWLTSTSMSASHRMKSKFFVLSRFYRPNHFRAAHYALLTKKVHNTEYKIYIILASLH